MRRDLPIPASPVMDTTCPWPAEARRQECKRVSISACRPTSWVSSGCRRSLNWLRLRRAPTTRHTCTGAGSPFKMKFPRSAYENSLPVSRRVLSAITIPLPGASVCRRAAICKVSPTAPCSSRVPSPEGSPTTAMPVEIPTRTCKCSPIDTRIFGTNPVISSAERIACSALSSDASM